MYFFVNLFIILLNPRNFFYSHPNISFLYCYRHGDETIEPLSADLHIHTVYSADAVIQPKTLVDMLEAHNSIKVAAVTDHDSVRGVKLTVQLASVYSDILIIPGVEISTPIGDIIVLGTDELPPKPYPVVVDMPNHPVLSQLLPIQPHIRYTCTILML